MSALVILLFAVMAQPATGTIVLRTEPGAEVIWGEVSLGRVQAGGSMEIRGIPPGVYQIVVRKTGFESHGFEMPVAPGLQTVDVRLRSLTSASTSVTEKVHPGTEALKAGPEPDQAEEPGQIPVGEDEDLPTAEQLERSSAVVQTSHLDIPLFWYLLVAGLLAVMIYRLVRSSKRRMGPPEPVRAFDLPDSAEEVPATSSSTFLEVLKQRENQLQDGVEVIPPKNGPTVDVDPESVRELDE